MGAFDVDEDRLLWQLFTRHGPTWRRVQLGFPNHTAAQLPSPAMTLIGNGPVVVA
jgi:hypothetical protein